MFAVNALGGRCRILYLLVSKPPLKGDRNDVCVVVDARPELPPSDGVVALAVDGLLEQNNETAMANFRRIDDDDLSGSLVVVKADDAFDNVHSCACVGEGVVD